MHGIEQSIEKGGTRENFGSFSSWIFPLLPKRGWVAGIPVPDLSYGPWKEGNHLTIGIPAQKYKVEPKAKGDGGEFNAHIPSDLTTSSRELLDVS